ncbi:glycosyltransferase family 2 protein [Micromonospora krabiensis]|uniref:CDP-glycerol glycerophosphotransferase n=1 Tax=Micromonospora krabiensis TaxID=307121 RepID=A0A1C3MZ62_9ACTN|nr:glycosyltransferase [Micromonospora krabiensis]SBV25601.1 CDP-glycerol glycerophosphotransferase [Micromonospora krabiensis]
MPPRLSVVVPFYNVAPYIGDCLRSVARQTFTDFEVVLVDDGSSDGSADVAAEFCARDPRFRLVRQDNQGLGPARNTGTAHSTGEYLAFVDSDDLVPAHAYELLVGSLDRTGSSLAAGNARRFNNTLGVRAAYLHRTIFAADREVTHILEYPALALDRMVWNKVYRRSFWTEHGYEFPPIRYEDYPVTLRAHLDAVTVDCLSAPVYYWRERESGESITQQKYAFGNLADRITSALMILDLVDERAPELRTPVHRHLTEIDLPTIVQGFGSVEEHERPALVELGQRLIRRLDPAARATARPLDRLQFRALEAGDADLLRRLADHRADNGVDDSRARRHPVLPWSYESTYPTPTGAARSVPRRLYRLPRRDMRLHTALTRVEWNDTDLVLRGTADIRHAPRPADDTWRLRMSLVRGLRAVSLPVRRFPARDTHGDTALVGFETRVPRRLLAAAVPDGAVPHIAVDIRVGPLHRRGRLSGIGYGSAQYPHGAWLTEDLWIQPSSGGEHFLLRPLRRPAELTEATVDGDALVLAGRLAVPAADATLTVARSSGTLRVPLLVRPGGDGRGFTARVPVADLIDAATPDDPFSQRTARVPRLDRDNALLLATGLRESVSVTHAGRLLTVTRSPGGYVNLFEGPVRLHADAAEVADGDAGQRLVLTGPWWEPRDPGRVVWRRFLDGSDAFVDVPCHTTYDDRSWSAAVAAADLLPPPGAGAIDWTLFVVPPDGTSPYAVQADPYLMAALPVDLAVGASRARLLPRAGRLHVEAD